MFFCVGFHKTGTTSLTEAFNILNIPAIHHPYQMYEEYKQGKEKFACLDGYEFASDAIIYLIYRQLDRNYPGSKFILTTRNTDSWVESVRHHFENGHKVRPELGYVSLWDFSSGDRFTHAIHEMAYGRRDFDEGSFREIYRHHNESVIEYFSGREKNFLLLDIDAGDLNWDKICAFTGKAAPQEEFPFLRKRSQSETYFKPKIEIAP